MKNPRWDHKDDYDWLRDERRAEVWAWEILKRNDEYRAAYHVFLVQKDELGKTDFDAYEPPRISGESVNAWHLRCAEEGVVPRKLSLSGAHALKWNLMTMYPPDILYNEGVAFCKVRQFPQLVERYNDLGLIPTINLADEHWDENFIHPNRGVVVFDLSQPLSPQIEAAGNMLQSRIKTSKVKASDTFGESKGRWLIHCRVKDALDFNSKIDRADLAIALVGEKDTKSATSKAGYDLIRQAKAFFTRTKHMSILMGVNLDKNSELKG